MKKELEYTREQAEEVTNDFIDFLNESKGIVVLGCETQDSFINHKFPPKIDYVGKVWKSATNKFIACFQKETNEHYMGYGFNSQGVWFEGEICKNDIDEVVKLTQATDKEWESVLIKEAEKKYKVGDIIKDLEGSNIRTFDEFNNFSCNKKYLYMNGVCIMKDGEWAEPKKEVELTLEEIADKFNVDIEQLKIKK